MLFLGKKIEFLKQENPISSGKSHPKKKGINSIETVKNSQMPGNSFPIQDWLIRINWEFLINYFPFGVGEIWEFFFPVFFWEFRWFWRGSTTRWRHRVGNSRFGDSWSPKFPGNPKKIHLGNVGIPWRIFSMGLSQNPGIFGALAVLKIPFLPFFPPISSWLHTIFPSPAKKKKIPKYPI